LDALRDAQLAMIQRRREAHGTAHPFYWGSFVLVGESG
ncbi:MAG: CHAT domain-containing protein, partial [Armatimonadetes bacterium]|nr:CHAT domain-containing protein [Armatimonadota bacterium]